MTEQEENYTKRPKYIDKIEKYPLGEGNWINTIPTSRGLRCWGDIEGENIQIEAKDPEEIEKKLFDYCTSAERTHTIKASNFGVLALKLKEGGLGKLEKTSKDLGGKK